MTEEEVYTISNYIKGQLKPDRNLLVDGYGVTNNHNAIERLSHHNNVDHWTFEFDGGWERYTEDWSIPLTMEECEQGFIFTIYNNVTYPLIQFDEDSVNNYIELINGL